MKGIHKLTVALLTVVATSTWNTTSDRRIKKNIVDNNDGLEKINAIQVRNFEYRLPEEVDPELKPSDAVNKKGIQLGVIAQELEQVFLGMVEESPDRDEDGNDLGTTTKSVKYSVFVPMLVKAIQEQQAIIQQLQADVAALKGQA